MRPFRVFLVCVTAMIIQSIFSMECYSQERAENPKIWFAKAGESGDGSDFTKPVGSTSEIERISSENDIIYLLPSLKNLEGGIRLKSGQSLIGLLENGKQPILTNKDSTRNEGNGIILSNNNYIENLTIQATYASGIYGRNVSNNRMVSLTVDSANMGGTYTAQECLLGPCPHGGIVLLNESKASQNYISDVKVLNATAGGIASVASKGARVILTINNSQVIGGERLDINDVGVANISIGPGTESKLILNYAKVEGRASVHGRNIIPISMAGAINQTKIYNSYIGFSGQDGVVAVAGRVPASIELEIVASTIEHAAQMNVEGAILNLPAYDNSRVEETLIDISIRDSEILNAGKIEPFFDDSRNIWLGATDFAQQIDPTATDPYQKGTYRLLVENSTIAGGLNYGKGFGTERTPNNIALEQNSFDVKLINNRIYDNGDHALFISAPNVRIEHSNNCWRNSEEQVKGLIGFSEKIAPYSLGIEQFHICK